MNLETLFSGYMVACDKARDSLEKALRLEAPPLANRPVDNDGLNDGDSLVRVACKVTWDVSDVGTPSAPFRPEVSEITRTIVGLTPRNTPAAVRKPLGCGDAKVAVDTLRAMLDAVAAAVPLDADVLEAPHIFVRREAWTVEAMAWATYREAKP